jgi:hypothetical protein
MITARPPLNVSARAERAEDGWGTEVTPVRPILSLQGFGGGELCFAVSRRPKGARVSL